MRIVVKSDGVLVVQLSFWNRLAAARCSDVVLPLALVKLPVRRQPQEAFRICKGLRVGTGIPGGLIAGSFYHLSSPPDFYYMSKAERTLAIDLHSPPCRYGKAILEVGPGESVEAVAAAIERAVEAHGAAQAVAASAADVGGEGEGRDATAAGGAQEPSLTTALMG